MVADSLDPLNWSSAIAVEDAGSLAREILARLQGQGGTPSVSVTELVDTRTAYYRRTRPLPIPREREARLRRGRDLHAAIGAVMAAPRYREVRVRQANIVGQIDLFERVPIELKTTSRLPAPGSVPAERPAYVEQLAMYCALVDESMGRLILVEPREPDPPKVVVLDGQFGDLPDIRAEMGSRARVLLAAIDQGDPTALPACAWKGRGCPYEEASACACTGAEPASSRRILQALRSLQVNELEARLLGDQLATIVRSPPHPRRFRDLLYPRRAYFEATRAVPGEGTAEPPEAPARPEPSGYRAVLDALEGGPDLEFARLPALTGLPEERVMTFRGRPMLLKTSRARPPRTVSELMARSPQYLLELALRCASIGSGEGHLMVLYESVAAPDDRLRASLLRLTDPAKIESLLRLRTEQLQRAIDTRDPGGLPACPAWMFPGCEFRAACHCGEAAPALS